METLSSAWHHDHPGEVLNKYTLMPNVAWHAFEEVFGNKELIKTGFRIAGLYPWDRKAVHWEKLDAGSLYVKEARAGVTDDDEPAVEEQEANVVAEEAALDTVEVGMAMEELETVINNVRGHDGVVHNGGNLEGRQLIIIDPALEEEVAGSGAPSEWAHDVADPTIAGLVDPSCNNNLQAPEVSLPPGPGEMVNQADSTPPGDGMTNSGSTPPGHDIANFVPRPGAQPEYIFPEMSHEEKLHLLHR